MSKKKGNAAPGRYRSRYCNAWERQAPAWRASEMTTLTGAGPIQSNSSKASLAGDSLPR